MTANKREVHLVGSIGLSDSETVFRTVSGILGSHCSRIPDGETGERHHWIQWQRDRIASNPDIELVQEDGNANSGPGNVAPRLYKVRDSIDPATVQFGSLGYAAAATASYEIFRKLVNDGVILPATRFQVALPTPMAILCAFILPEHRLALEPAMEAAILTEVALIQSAIPAKHLAIQWDAPREVIAAAGGPQLPYTDGIEGSLRRLGHLSNFVEPEAELGVHLCYGDLGHKHTVEPIDLTIAVAFANGLSQTLERRLDYVHMPVPISRFDDSYFRPLAHMKVSSSTRLVLGLIHFTDGVQGTRQRIEAASRHVREFDIATECGFGRRDPSTVPALLEIHRQLVSDGS
ncbi:hypothetical protein [Granulicella sp. dw_53]|uniref:hypothetical protein n=1 Tax=Granulicella sp. dw_53 TaxID=2719792 RepID=UPI001BD34DE8|nr:hypothetical protein [Granulicella sp. dw_53]